MTTIGTRVPAIQLSVPVAWQRTGVVGTELVLPERDGARGTAVVTGPEPFVLDWRASVDDDAAVTGLVVGCRGAGWDRTLEMCRAGGRWVTHPDLDPDAVVRVDESPIFLTWVVLRLGLTPDSGPVTAPTVRVAVPDLTVSVTRATFQLLSAHRLRVTGDGPAVTYELDAAGVVTSRAGSLRRVPLR